MALPPTRKYSEPFSSNVMSLRWGACPMMSLLSRVSLKLTAPLVLSLPVLLAVIVISWIFFQQGRAAAKQQAFDQLGVIHGRIDQQLGDLFRMPGRVNRVNARLIEEGRLDRADLRAWRDYLYQQATAFDMLSGIMWGSAEGEVVWMFRYPGKPGYEFGIRDAQTGDEVLEFRMDARGVPGREPVGQYAYDPRKRPWYEDAQREGKPTWTEYAWVNEDGSEVTYGLARAQPHYDAQGKLLGVLDSEVSLHDVSRFLASLEVGRSGLAFLIDHEGLIVANSLGLSVHDAQLNRIPAASLDHPLIAGAAAALAAGDPAPGAAGFHDSLTLDGTRHLLIVSPLGGATGLDWRIVTVVPESDFLAEVQAGWRRSILFGAAAVLATLLLGVVLAILSVRPIFQLVRFVRAVGAGNLDARLGLDYASEFRQLSEEINAMTAGLRDRMRLRHSLALAMEVQQNLLPSDEPKVAGLDISGHSTYCDETGGDYYDFLDVAGLSDKAVAVALGDVMGHGVAAAMLMATARGILRSRCQEPGSLGDLLGHMNQMLVGDTGGERFMTMLLLTLDMERHETRWASAGHDPPMLYDAQLDEFIEQDGDGGLPLGIVEGAEFEEHCCGKVRSGQIYIVSTDGLWETANQRDEVFGKDRLKDLIRRHAAASAKEINRQIHAELDAFRGPSNQEDDVTFVIVKVE